MEILTGLRNVGLSAVLIGSAACGTSSGESGPPTTMPGQVEVSNRWGEDGSRRYTVSGGGLGVTFLTECDGPDMVEVNINAGTVERSVGHPACADGRLTPEDFAPRAK